MSLSLSNLLIELGYEKLLTMDDIIRTIDAYREAHDGCNPVSNRGDIEEGPLAGLLKWGSLSEALRKGANGLREDPEWQTLETKLGKGNVSLAKVLIELGHKDQPIQFTIDDVIETIDAYKDTHDGDNPTQDSVDIKEGPLAGTVKWVTLSKALERGWNGLSEDPKWQALEAKLGKENLKLHTLLIELGYKKPPVQLTIALIVETIEAYREAHDGKNPSNAAEDIKEGPLAGYCKWGALNAALRKGERGLDQDPEWHALEEKLGKSKVSIPKICIEIGFKDPSPQFTMDRIVETIDSYRAVHNGRNPTVISGEVENGPLDGLITWTGVNTALRYGTNSLKEDPKWQELNTKLGEKDITLKQLLIELGYKAPSLTIDLIIETIDAYRKAHDGKNPLKNSGDIEEGPLAKVTTWAMIASSLVSGGNDLKNDSRWQELKAKLGETSLTLPVLLDELGYKTPPLRLTIQKISEAVEAYRTAHNGENPVQNKGIVKEGPIAGLLTWMGVDSALRTGTTGLEDDPEWLAMNEKYGGKFSLAKLKQEYTNSPSTPDSQNDLPAPGEP